MNIYLVLKALKTDSWDSMIPLVSRKLVCIAHASIHDTKNLLIEITVQPSALSFTLRYSFILFGDFFLRMLKYYYYYHYYFYYYYL